MTEKLRDQSYTEDDTQTASDREYPQVSDEGIQELEANDEILVRNDLQQTVLV